MQGPRQIRPVPTHLCAAIWKYVLRLEYDEIRESQNSVSEPSLNAAEYRTSLMSHGLATLRTTPSFAG
jgi:hypothetical protein